MADPEPYPRLVYEHRRTGIFAAGFALSLLLVFLDPAFRESPAPHRGLEGFGIVLAIIVTLTCFVLLRRTEIWILTPRGEVRVRHRSLLRGIDEAFLPSTLELQVFPGPVLTALRLGLPRRLDITLRLGGRRKLERMAKRLSLNLGISCRFPGET